MRSGVARLKQHTQDDILEIMLNQMPHLGETPKQFRKRTDRLKARLIRENQEEEHRANQRRKASTGKGQELEEAEAQG